MSEEESYENSQEEIAAFSDDESIEEGGEEGEEEIHIPDVLGKPKNVGEKETSDEEEKEAPDDEELDEEIEEAKKEAEEEEKYEKYMKALMKKETRTLEEAQEIKEYIHKREEEEAERKRRAVYLPPKGTFYEGKGPQRFITASDITGLEKIEYIDISKPKPLVYVGKKAATYTVKEPFPEERKKRLEEAESYFKQLQESKITLVTAFYALLDEEKKIQQKQATATSRQQSAYTEKLEEIAASVKNLEQEIAVINAKLKDKSDVMPIEHKIKMKEDTFVSIEKRIKELDEKIKSKPKGRDVLLVERHLLHQARKKPMTFKQPPTIASVLGNKLGGPKDILFRENIRGYLKTILIDVIGKTESKVIWLKFQNSNEEILVVTQLKSVTAQPDPYKIAVTKVVQASQTKTVYDLDDEIIQVLTTGKPTKDISISIQKTSFDQYYELASKKQREGSVTDVVSGVSNLGYFAEWTYKDHHQEHFFPSYDQHESTTQQYYRKTAASVRDDIIKQFKEEVNDNIRDKLREVERQRLVVIPYESSTIYEASYEDINGYVVEWEFKGKKYSSFFTTKAQAQLFSQRSYYKEFSTELAKEAKFRKANIKDKDFEKEAQKIHHNQTDPKTLVDGLAEKYGNDFYDKTAGEMLGMLKGDSVLEQKIKQKLTGAEKAMRGSSLATILMKIIDKHILSIPPLAEIKRKLMLEKYKLTKKEVNYAKVSIDKLKKDLKAKGVEFAPTETREELEKMHKDAIVLDTAIIQKVKQAYANLIQNFFQLEVTKGHKIQKSKKEVANIDAQIKLFEEKCFKKGESLEAYLLKIATPIIYLSNPTLKEFAKYYPANIKKGEIPIPDLDEAGLAVYFPEFAMSMDDVTESMFGDALEELEAIKQDEVKKLANIYISSISVAILHPSGRGGYTISFPTFRFEVIPPRGKFPWRAYLETYNKVCGTKDPGDIVICYDEEFSCVSISDVVKQVIHLETPKDANGKPYGEELVHSIITKYGDLDVTGKITEEKEFKPIPFRERKGVAVVAEGEKGYKNVLKVGDVIGSGPALIFFHKSNIKASIEENKIFEAQRPEGVLLFRANATAAIPKTFASEYLVTKFNPSKKAPFFVVVDITKDGLVEIGSKTSFEKALELVGGAAKVKGEVEEGLDTKDAKGLTPLMRAVEEVNLEDLRLLLESGANPNKKGKGGNTPLLFALQKGLVPPESFVLPGEEKFITTEEGKVRLTAKTKGKASHFGTYVEMFEGLKKREVKEPKKMLEQEYKKRKPKSFADLPEIQKKAVLKTMMASEKNKVMLQIIKDLIKVSKLNIKNLKGQSALSMLARWPASSSQLKVGTWLVEKGAKIMEEKVMPAKQQHKWVEIFEKIKFSTEEKKLYLDWLQTKDPAVLEELQNLTEAKIEAVETTKTPKQEGQTALEIATKLGNTKFVVLLEKVEK